MSQLTWLDDRGGGGNIMKMDGDSATLYLVRTRRLRPLDFNFQLHAHLLQKSVSKLFVYPCHQNNYMQLFLFSGINFLMITIRITF